MSSTEADADDEEEEEDDDDDEYMIVRRVDQFPTVRPPPKSSNHYHSNNNISSSKQTTSTTSDRTKAQTTTRSTSLPSRQTFSSNITIQENVRPRRRYSSDSNKNNTNVLVNSFIQYLRSELRATTNDQKYDHSRIHKKKSTEKLNYSLQTFNYSNNFYRQQYPIRMSSSSSISSSTSLCQSIESNLNNLSTENVFKNSLDNSDDNEILKLINLLLLRVECLANENDENSNNSSAIRQIDQNLMEYLYYLFNKFVNDSPDNNKPMIDKANFVNVCQTLVRNGCFNVPSTLSPEQSYSEATITNSSDLTATTYASVQEYKSNIDHMSEEKSLLNEQMSTVSTNDQETWLVVDLDADKSKLSVTNLDESKCLFPSSTSDEQFLLSNENYFSFEEIKSCESESSHSNYFSPNSSLVDIQNMVQEFDELNNTNHNNNNNNNNTIFNEDGSSTIDHASNNTNVIIEETQDSPRTTNSTITNNNNICTGLTNGSESIVLSSSSLMESTTDSLTIKSNDQISRREKRMQERWTKSTKTDNNNCEQSSPKTFLGVEFPPIAVLRRKFSSSSSSTPPIVNPISIKKKDNFSNKTKILFNNPSQDNNDKSTDHITSATSIPSNQETIVNKSRSDQIYDVQLNDLSSLNDCKTNDIQNENMTANFDEKPLLINSNKSELLTDLLTLNSPQSSSSLLSISSSLTSQIHENKSNEILLKEQEEEEEQKEKKEEEYCDDDNDKVYVEKKNNCNIEQTEHASGTILINGEPRQAVLLDEQEKEEKEKEETEQPSSSLLLQIPDSSQQIQLNENSSTTILSNNLAEINMTNINENEQRYKAIEIEEIPDEDDDDLSIHNNVVEPTDYILTDDELKVSSQVKTKPTDHSPIQSDPIVSCYEKALSKTIDDKTTSSSSTATKRHQRPEDDPIALRALERFEQRMNAAAAVTKPTNNDETNSLTTKGKSSWSSSHSITRKSMENLFKTNQPSQSNSLTNNEESTTQRETFIRPRKTMLDDTGLNFGMTFNIFGSTQKSEDQQEPKAIIENDDKPIVTNELVNKNLDIENQSMTTNSSMTNEINLNNEEEESSYSIISSPFVDNALNTVISQSSTTEQQTVTPYRLQLEGRRRLNTLERVRERSQNSQPNDLSHQQQQQYQNEYVLKPEDLQDPIIRRALERFDEKSRSLAQNNSMNYDQIQDPITRRALMRLDNNLKRTVPSNPPPIPNTDSNETWYTNSYTLGTLQSNNIHRYPDSSLPPTTNYKPSHISIHQRFNSTSNADMSDLSTNYVHMNNEQDIPTLRVPAQPIYVTSNTQPQGNNIRQRSRSEDMLVSRDLSIGQTTNLDEDNSATNFEHNHSVDELQQQESEDKEEQEQEQAISLTNESELSSPPNPLTRSLDANFNRTDETSVTYTTPTQTYSAYNGEYTRPHPNQLLTSPRNFQSENDIQYSNLPTSSAFTLVHPSTNNSYPQQQQQPLSTSAYTPMYSSNNLNQTPYSDDPIVRRALERFNSQLQNSVMNMSQHHPSVIPRHGYAPQQGNFDSIDPHQYDPWNNTFNTQRSIPPTSSSNTSTGYQSIIGRRRQMRHDDIYHDTTTIGNGYSSSLFINSQQNLYPYESPPIAPPRLHRDMYHEQQEYLCENMNNNNNNNSNPYLNHGYPPAMNGFRPINNGFLPTDPYQQMQEDEYLRYRAQSTSSNTSSDSVHPIRFMQQRVPQAALRTNLPPQNKHFSPENLQISPDQTMANNGNGTNDSVFHRLAYTATKSSLSKSSSNLCANILNKSLQTSQPQTQLPNKSNSFKTQDIDDDQSTSNNHESNQESAPLNTTTTTIVNKCQRSKSVDGRARLKNAQNRLNNSANNNNDDDNNNHHQSTNIPSSKFTSITPRRDMPPPPRIPVTPRSAMISDRASLAKRISNGNNLTYNKNTNGLRIRNSNGNLIDTENDENSTSNDTYQPKIIDHKTRIAIPVHRYTTNNNNNQIQTSASTSSVMSTNSRTKVPVPTSSSSSLLSPNGQRRAIPVSVFAPAKLEPKRPAPLSPTSSSTSPTNDVNTTYNGESQQQQQQQDDQQQTSSSSHVSTDESNSSTINENDIHTKLSPTDAALKSSTGNLLNDFSSNSDKHDSSKKMNVFERLFRGHKKKI